MRDRRAWRYSYRAFGDEFFNIVTDLDTCPWRIGDQGMRRRKPRHRDSSDHGFGNVSLAFDQIRIDLRCSLLAHARNARIFLGSGEVMTRTRFAGCHRSTAANLVDVFKKIGRILISRYAVKKQPEITAPSSRSSAASSAASSLSGLSRRPRVARPATIEWVQVENRWQASLIGGAFS